jgi:hypothetical protein
MNQLIASPRRLCIINMYPFIRLPQLLRGKGNIIVADINLADWERSLNPRTISMPVPPITDGVGNAAEKNLLASFRGIGSYPARLALAKLHDGHDFICELIPPDGHVGKIDAASATQDPAFSSLMSRSTFAFVPRGDAMFSYRLIEALSFGCIPVILSDGWVLPFDRLIDWHSISLRFPELRIREIPPILKGFAPNRVSEMRASALQTYRGHFAGTDRVVNSLLDEIERQLTGGST